jgi:hypothetical protein
MRETEKQKHSYNLEKSILRMRRAQSRGVNRRARDQKESGAAGHERGQLGLG